MPIAAATAPPFTEVSEPVDVVRVSAMHATDCGGTFVVETSNGNTRPLKTPLGPNGFEVRHSCTRCKTGVWIPNATYPRFVYVPRVSAAEAPKVDA